METLGQMLEVVLICFIFSKVKELYEELVRRYEAKKTAQREAREQQQYIEFIEQQMFRTAQTSLMASWSRGEI